MPKYQVTVLFDASAGMTVEADTPEDAAEKAECEMDGRQSLCHQCARQLDTGDVIGTLVCLGDDIVLDTTAGADKVTEIAQLRARIAELEAQQ